MDPVELGNNAITTLHLQEFVCHSQDKEKL